MRWFLVLALMGCGDPLYGGSSLDELLGVAPPPAQPAWEIRWLGPDGELYVDCALQPIDQLYSDEVLYGEVWAIINDLPSTDAPEFEPGVRLGLAALVDQEVYRPYTPIEPDFFPDDEDEFDPDFDAELQMETREAEERRGVWGYAVNNVVVDFSNADPEDIDRYVTGDGYEPAGGPEWLGFLPTIVDLTGSPNGALFYDDEVTLEEVGVGSIGFTDPTFVELFNGLYRDGAVAWGDCE